MTQDIYDNPVLPQNIDTLHSVSLTITPNDVSARCFDTGIPVDEDQVLHIMHVIEERMKEEGGVNWSVIDEIVREVTGKSELLKTISDQNTRIVNLIRTIDLLHEKIRSFEKSGDVFTYSEDKSTPVFLSVTNGNSGFIN